ncbi:MAG: hypothetical protein QM820_64010 [Minicystis sp.]
MPSSRWRSVVRIAGVLLAFAGALFQIQLLGRLFAGRVRYPWDVEWLESSALYQAYRVQKNLYTYGPFKDGYIALNHPPGYPTLLGLVGKVIGVDYTMARAISFLFFVGASALVVRALVRHQRGRVEGWALGAFAVGVAAAGAPVFEAFYDLVREDVMAVFLSVLCAALVDNPAKKMRPRRIALVALVITAIVYTRQPAVFFPVWIVLYVFARHRRTGFMLALAAAALCGLVLVGIQFTSKGWYWMLTIGLMQNHHVTGQRFLLGLDIIYKFAPFIVAIPVATIALAVTRRMSASAALWVGMLVASLPAALLPFAKVGGFSNDFMPLVFLIGPAAAFLVSDLINLLDRRPRAQLAVATSLFAACAAFLFLRNWDIKRFLPSDDHYRRAKAINAKVASLKGGVLCPREPFVPIHNGNNTLEWSDMPYLDMMWSNYGDLNLGGYIDRSKAKWALIMGTEVPLTQRELIARYQYEGPTGEYPTTIIGERSQMRYLLRLQDSEKDARVLFDFEQDLNGWTVTGDAFQITPTKPAWEAQIYGAVGQKLVNSYHPTKKDSATGTLTSPPFTIDRPHLAFRIGGGWRNGTRVELRVNGRTERRANGIFEYNETMLKMVWDVSALMGKEAKLVLIDEDSGSWAHLLFDHVILY